MENEDPKTMHVGIMKNSSTSRNKDTTNNIKLNSNNYDANNKVSSSLVVPTINEPELPAGRFYYI